MNSYHFDFGLEAAEPGFTKVKPDTQYTPECGYGFTSGSVVFGRYRGGTDILRNDFCIPQRAVLLIDLPDGFYRVTVRLGDACAETHTVIRAGDARFVLHPLRVPAEQYLQEGFSVHVTSGQLRLSFSGAAPRINELLITPDPEARGLFLAGDSTVTDQGETGFPYAGWGQMLPLFFKPGVAVDNRALSGRSSRSFIQEGHLKAIMSAIRPKDYLFLQFGHNDSKPDEFRHTEPFTTYKEHLLQYITEARQAGAYPVLVTSVHRRMFNPHGEIIDSHGDYLVAMKELAAAEQVPLIDLAAKSRKLFEEYGPEGTKELFMWTHPGEYLHHPAGVQDNTHFQVKGAQLVAGLVAEGIREAGLYDLTVYMR
ncbi:hypothetical protein GCM10010912_32730 [Paenibacillus albidus]|uniref:GDSL family lipase n=1 Tax=Paenibacillus albidus TaxID=2041023 RepID=A0A917CGK7_9BACL|nr:rhamnogalacturonan acetylesterase [Paenibacillus albidus]GGF84933.1 hypothetical protein GCM10010912_32730 [Paenibacillus albidus]